jgi:hypothetical protein
MTVVITSNEPRLADDELLILGNDDDNVLLHRSAALGVNTALTGVLSGTVSGHSLGPVTPALPANSLILSNTTVGSDVMFAAMGKMGDGESSETFYDNSTSFLWYDGSGTYPEAGKLGMFTTENAANYKVQIGEEHPDGTKSLYREILFAYGGDGGSNIARFQRRTGSNNHVIDIHASAGDPQITFVRSLGAGPVHYSIGQDASGTRFKIVKDTSLYAQSTRVAGSGTSIMEANLAETVFNENAIDQDFRIEGLYYVDTSNPTDHITTLYQNLFYVNAAIRGVGINTASPAALLHIDQSLTAPVGSGGVDGTPVIPLQIDQADLDAEFIRFTGATHHDTDVKTRTIVKASAATASATGYVKINVQDVHGTSPIADGPYYMPFYTLS